MLSNLGYLEIVSVKSTHFNTCLSFHKNHWEVISAYDDDRYLPKLCGASYSAWNLYHGVSFIQLIYYQ